MSLTSLPRASRSGGSRRSNFARAMTRSTMVGTSARVALRTSMSKPACVFSVPGKMVSQTFTGHQSFNHLEHPDQAAERILKEHVGIEDATLKLVEVESFVGNNETWHLIFDYLAFPRTMKVSTGPTVSDAKWFEIDKLPSAEEFAHHGWGKSVLLKHALAKAQPAATM